MSLQKTGRILLGSLSLLAVACSNSSDSYELPVPRNAKNTRIEDERIQTLGQTASNSTVKNWFTRDPELDGAEGVRSDRAYAELGLRTGVEPIIVAVIDSGVDVNHEDLKDHMWVNEDEIANNGIDDDENGFADDIHGWNFLGTMKKGKPVHVGATTLEVTRELVRMKKLKARREAKGRKLNEQEQAYLNEVNAVVTNSRDAAKTALDKYLSIQSKLKELYAILKTDLNVEFEQLTLALVQALQPTDPDKVAVKEEMEKTMKDNGVTTVARLNRLVQSNSDQINYYYNESFDPRRQIIGDDLNDFDDTEYGNPDVQGPDAFHGTHVSGIIGAIKANGIGIDGVATDVKIMAIRAVPNGDEYDKDVANAVRYAVNNGARVINMSFGKAYSSINKSKVDQAFSYAASKGVVIVHSAGNDAKENTPFNNFPNKYVKGSAGVTISNWIEVGASSATNGVDLPAFFSNYGKETVDIFAPGYLVESTVPGNKYGVASGTSMAGPCVAGVAAAILSQAPGLSGTQVRDLIRQSARGYPSLMVNKPTDGDPMTVLFSSLSSTGGVADLYAAIRRMMTPQ